MSLTLRPIVDSVNVSASFAPTVVHDAYTKSGVGVRGQWCKFESRNWGAVLFQFFGGGFSPSHGSCSSIF